MNFRKAQIISLFLVLGLTAFGQKKDLPLSKNDSTAQLGKVDPSISKEKKDDSFGDYVKKAGQGIWNRLKMRFNLDEASDNLKKKGNQLFGSKEKNQATKPTTKKPPPKDKVKKGDN